MPYFKGSYIFRQAEYGWSESWYLQENNITLATNRFRDTIKPRVRMVGRFTSLDYIRVSDADSPGDVTLEDASTYKVLANLSDLAPAAILVRVDGGEEYRRSMWLRGMDDTLFSRHQDASKGVPGTVVDVFDVVNIALKEFLVEAQKAQFRLKVQRKDNTGRGDGNRILDVIPAPPPYDGYVAIVLEANLPNTPPDNAVEGGQKLLIRKGVGRDARLWNRSWPVLDVEDNVAVLALDADCFNEWELLSYGVAYTRIPGFVPLDKIAAIRHAVRETGSTFFRPRGRSSRSCRTKTC